MVSMRPIHMLLLHGLGANGDDLMTIGRMLAEQIQEVPAFASKRFSLHAPDAPEAPVTINNGYRMPSWFDIYGLDRDAPVDLPGIDVSVQRIVSLIESTVGDDPYVLIGFSQGGVIALRAACVAKQAPMAVVLLSTWLPAAEAFVLPDDRMDMPVFIGHGRQDDVVPFASAERMENVLRAAGATRVERHGYPMAHQICPEEMADMARFLASALPHSN